MIFTIGKKELKMAFSTFFLQTLLKLGKISSDAENWYASSKTKRPMQSAVKYSKFSFFMIFYEKHDFHAFYYRKKKEKKMKNRDFCRKVILFRKLVLFSYLLNKKKSPTLKKSLC